jgi:hypothetical protein
VRVNRRLTVLSASIVVLSSFLLAQPVTAATKQGPVVTPIYEHYWDSNGCDDGSAPVIFAKRQRVMFYTSQSSLWKENPTEADQLRLVSVEAGEQYCKMPWSLGPLGVQRTNGVVTGITTPGFPTVSEIKELGLSVTTPVAKGLKIPRPIQPESQGFFPTSVRPVRSWVDPDLIAAGEHIQNAVMVEWEIAGGDGVSVESWRSSDGDSAYVPTKMNPSGSVRVIQNSFVCYHGTNSGTADFKGRIEKDFGQEYLPESTIRDWRGLSVKWTPGYEYSVPGKFSPTWNGIQLLNPGG